MTTADLRTARAVFWWAVHSRRIPWSIFRALMRSVVEAESRINQCQGKEAFLTFEAATWVATNRTGRDGHRTRKAYRCRWCGHFHLGSISPDVRALRIRHRQAAYG